MQQTTIPPARKPITAPPGPADASQLPTRTHHAEPIIEPNPKANIWKRPILPLSAVPMTNFLFAKLLDYQYSTSWAPYLPV